jgi:hypothetical protein
MKITYTMTVVITADTQQEVFDTFGELVDAVINVANSQPTAHIEVDELDPSKLSYSGE